MKWDTQTLCSNTGFFLHPFPFFRSLFFTHVSPVCYHSQSLSLTSNFASSSPVFSISFYLPFFALHVCRLIHKLSLCFVVHVVFKIIIIIFSQTQLAMQFLAKKRGRQRSWPSIFPPKKTDLQHKVWVSHFMLAYMQSRTYVRWTVGRTEVTSLPNQNFSHWWVYQSLLAMGLRRARLRRARELRYNPVVKKKN